MGTPSALLALLLPGRRHGYDLKRAYDDWFSGLRPIAFGQVYATLGRLQRDALVSVVQVEAGSGPERVVYELTATGRRAALDWLTEPVDPVAGGADELLRKTIAVHLLDAGAARFVARQRTVHLRALRAMEAATIGPEPGAALLADHTRLHLDADLRWLDLATERMREVPPRTQLPARPGPGEGDPPGPQEPTSEVRPPPTGALSREGTGQ